MNQKVIFLDIDGTLTEPGHNDPPESALWAIRQARQQGHYVILCTGRNYDMLKPLLRYDFDGVIASSGGYVECRKEVIFDSPMPQAQTENALELLKEHGIFRTVECMDGSYTDEEFKEFLKNHAKEGSNSEMLRWREQIEKSLHILPMKEYRGQPVYKIVFMSRTMQQLDQPMKILGTDFHFCIQDADKYGFVNGEVLGRQYDKGKAVGMACRHLNIPPADAVAIGDSMNDKEMLEAAGLGICMGNGSESVKKIADDVCPSVTDDGIREAFRKYQLI